jgi:hypothetical protein
MAPCGTSSRLIEAFRFAPLRCSSRVHVATTNGRARGLAQGRVKLKKDLFEVSMRGRKMREVHLVEDGGPQRV